MSVEGQEQAAWVALTNDPSVYTSTRPREVFAHGYRAAYVDLHQQLVRANNEDAERYEAERAVLVEALKELVRLKEIKGNLGSARLTPAEYEAAKEKAWQVAWSLVAGVVEPEPCPRCKGTGGFDCDEDGQEMRRCVKCGGSGKREAEPDERCERCGGEHFLRGPEPAGDSTYIVTPCPTCNADGEKSRYKPAHELAEAEPDGRTDG